MKRNFFLGTMTLLVCVLLAGLGQAQVFSGSVTLKKADYVQFDGSFGLAAVNDWTDLLYMTKTFKISGLGKDEVAVMFQAQWSDCYSPVEIRLLIDGLVQGEGRWVWNPASSSDISSNGYIWTTKPLTAGVTHTAQIQFYVSGGGYVTGPSMVILHK